MTDLRIQYLEKLVGYGHPKYADTLNRRADVEHNPDGTHSKITGILDPWVDVRAFGATGGDDTDAIKAAIESLALTGGEIRLIPNTTHTVRIPDTDTYAGGTIYKSFNMYSNIKIVGNNTTIKLADDSTTISSPKELSIFFSNDYLTNVIFEGITFDLNGANNSTNSTNILNNAIAFSGDDARCDDLVIRDCKFKNGVGASILTLAQSNTSGSQIGQRNRIENNYFYFTNSYLTVTDHSTIFGRTENSLFLNNVFEFSGVRSDDIGVACEIQGQNNIFALNKVYNYSQALWLTSNYTNKSQYITVTNNLFKVKNLGIDFWNESVNAKGLGTININNNIMELEDTATSLQQKVCVQCAAQYSVDNIFVHGNIFRKIGNVIKSAGVSFATNLAGQKHENIVIDGNIFDSFYLGLASNDTAADIGLLKVINNTFRNHNNLTAVEFSATGVFVYAVNNTVDEVIIDNNTFIVDNGSSWPFGIWLGAVGTGAFGSITAKCNRYKGHSSLGPVEYMSYFENSITSNSTKRFGEEPLLLTAAPTTGYWYKGQRVYNSTPTVGQPKSWVCTVTGGPGTWVSEGNL